MLEVTLAIVGLLTVVAGAVVKFWKPKREPTLLDRLAEVDRELAERDGAAVNARIERGLRLLDDPRRGGAIRPPSGAAERRPGIPSASRWVVRSDGKNAGTPPRAREKG